MAPPVPAKGELAMPADPIGFAQADRTTIYFIIEAPVTILLIVLPQDVTRSRAFLVRAMDVTL